LQAKRNISLVQLLKLFKRKVCDKRIGIVQRELQKSPCVYIKERLWHEKYKRGSTLNFFSFFIDSRNSKENEDLHD